MRIYLFRGLLGSIFSRGMNKLAKKLKAKGHKVSVHSWVRRKSVERKIRKSDDDVSPIGIVGHSLGGNSANYMGKNLSEMGYNVRGVVCIDATKPKRIKSVPGYAFVSKDFRAKPVPGLKTISMPHLSHTQIDKHEAVHHMILQLFN